MTEFDENLKVLQDRLARAGYARTYEPFDTSMLEKEHAVVDIEIIARKDFYNVLYMEARANWRSISSDVAKKNPKPCLVMTRYRDSHIILSTVKDHYTHPKLRYLVIEAGAKGNHNINTFIDSIKVGPDDNIDTIDTKVQETFDRFATYGEALKEFGNNLGVIIEKTREMVENAATGNRQYDKRVQGILNVWREVINDKMDEKDIKDMLIQHILTYRIFSMVYDNHDFHNTNAVACALESLKRLLNISNGHVDYQTMELIAESITGSDQRQEFLKKIYETFYEKYDPAKADKDGIVYTPSEIVNFMVTSTDQLLKKHFGKSLSDKDVSILDPATGTGTFIVHVLRQISTEQLKIKFDKELHANEISILPYYIAALNIEHTYKERMGEYQEFQNICWMDTLDSGIRSYEKITTYFDDDNIKRISRQQKSKIHVIIGNPPYNAVQANFNNVNPSDMYPHIDKKIQEDYSGRSRVQGKIKSQDMYKRFLKWASERIKGKGLVAFVSNNSFLDAKADDGVRRALYDEFDYIYVINTKGKSRDVSGEEAYTEGENVFNVRVGISISFFIKTGENYSEIQYTDIGDHMKRKEKLTWLNEHTISTLKFKKIIPNKNAIWLNQTNNNFYTLPPVVSKEIKESIFKISIPGISTAKDDWVYDFNKSNLKNKIKYYVLTYNDMLKKYQNKKFEIKNLAKYVDKKIKWSTTTLSHIKQMKNIEYSDDNIKPTLYRPFVIKYQYFDDYITERPGKFLKIFPNFQKNYLIVFSNPATNVLFNVFGTNRLVDYNGFDSSQNIPLWQYDDGKKSGNITEYGLKLFHKHYKNTKITYEDIFYYVYAMFNDPKYEQTYRYNLRRSLPRIPLAKYFDKYSIIGKRLFDLHCNFSNQMQYGLKRTDKIVKKNNIKLQLKKGIRNTKNTKNKIVIDNMTTLENIPNEVFEYTFESRSPLWYILTYYKEKKNHISKKSSNDESVRKKFNTYKFDDYKEELITLLNKVTTVCVETVKLRKELEYLEWGPQPKLTFTVID